MPLFDQSKLMGRARSGVQAALHSPDLMLVQVVGAVDELNKIANLASERLNEWYGLHFPELRLADPLKYAQVALLLDRENPDAQALEALLGPQAAQNILTRAKSSVGVAFAPEDLQAVRAHAQAIIDLMALREKHEKYEETLALRLVPNLSILAGPLLASKLVAQAGGLNKLASFPASTIQVIGAEKALFKHLKSGSPPPKHGLIFQYPAIANAPKRARGKIARALAAKLAIAAKADAFTHNDIAAKLKEQLDARVKTILENVAKNPERVGRRPSSFKSSSRRPDRSAPSAPLPGFDSPSGDSPRGPPPAPRSDTPRSEGRPPSSPPGERPFPGKSGKPFPSDRPAPQGGYGAKPYPSGGKPYQKFGGPGGSKPPYGGGKSFGGPREERRDYGDRPRGPPGGKPFYGGQGSGPKAYGGGKKFGKPYGKGGDDRREGGDRPPFRPPGGPGAGPKGSYGKRSERREGGEGGARGDSRYGRPFHKKKW